MAFDGITTSAVVYELDKSLSGGHIAKIAQPESDELMITVKNNRKQIRLLISVNGGIPFVCLTGKNIASPMTAPNFCMFLRKHIGSGKIISITQPGLERVIDFEVEHLNELGDVCRKHMYVELMGKYSNIIFCDDEGTILDSIKHVSALVSSVREVLPGRKYFIPAQEGKMQAQNLSEEIFAENVLRRPLPLAKALYGSIVGFSPVMAEEICYRAGLDGDMQAVDVDAVARHQLYSVMQCLLGEIKDGTFSPTLYYKNGVPQEFSAVSLNCLGSFDAQHFETISETIEKFYDERNAAMRIRQKSTDLRRIVNTALERDVKKYDLQRKQLKDTEKREKYRIWGELLHAYGYEVSPGDKTLHALDYYNNKEIDIPLEPTLTAAENAKKYFERYNKLKRTAQALGDLIRETSDDIEHLRSVSQALDIAVCEDDLAQIREELQESGYIRKHFTREKKKKIVSVPFEYVTEDGFHIFVGRNNIQNEELTFRFANGNDMWFHAKGVPGSHVIVRTEGRELPDHVYEQAAGVAAYYSSARDNEKVEIDYVEKKQVKKPPQAKPGFVIYHTNYSMMASPGLEGLTQIQ